MKIGFSDVGSFVSDKERAETERAYWATGFWQGLFIGLAVAFFGMLAEFIVMIS